MITANAPMQQNRAKDPGSSSSDTQLKAIMCLRYPWAHRMSLEKARRRTLAGGLGLMEVGAQLY